MKVFVVVFAIDLPHGACVAVALPPADTPLDAAALEPLVPEERAFAEALVARRRVAWIGGRIALRAAFARAGIPQPAAILATSRGAPALPPYVVASISHKESIAVALAAPADGATRGVDVEIDPPLPHRIDVAARVLRDEELAEVDALAPDERARAVLLRFSAKEAIYKALDPYVGRYVGFKEASVAPRDDGSATATLHLAKDHGDFDVDVRWLRRDGVVVTSARIRRAHLGTRSLPT